MSNFWDDKLPTDYYDKNLKNGLERNRGVQCNWHNITFLSVREKIKKGYFHLDYACGPGSFIGNYLESKCVGLDISKNQIRYAKKNYGKLGNFLEIKDFDFEKHKNYFDSISAIGLLEYLSDKETIEFLKNMESLLKPGGKLIITTPNYGASMRILEFVMHIFGPINYSSEHKNKHNFTSLKSLLNSSKFSTFSIKKIVNIGIVFSLINLDLGIRANNFIKKILRDKYGFLFLVELQKKNK